MNIKSFWYKLRKEYSNYSQKQFAEKLGVKLNTISRWELGSRKIPVYAQIEYLKLRNSEEDQAIIEYLKNEEGLLYEKRKKI